MNKNVDLMRLTADEIEYLSNACADMYIPKNETNVHISEEFNQRIFDLIKTTIYET